MKGFADWIELLIGHLFPNFSTLERCGLLKSRGNCIIQYRLPLCLQSSYIK